MELPNASTSTIVAEEQKCSGVLAVTLQSINERLQRLELRLKNSEAITEREDKGSPASHAAGTAGKEAILLASAEAVIQPSNRETTDPRRQGPTARGTTNNGPERTHCLCIILPL